MTLKSTIGASSQNYEGEHKDPLQIKKYPFDLYDSGRKL